VQAVADKARANVRKMLAPQLEAEAKAAEEARLAEEKRKADEEAARQAELKRQQEEAAKNTPPPAVVKPVEPAKGPSVRALALIPGIVGVGSAAVATGFLLSANGKYNALKNGSAPPELAISYRDSGKTDATVGYVFTGVAAAGIAAAVVMFAVGGEKAPAATVSAVPLESGGYVSATVQFDLGGVR
jgi:hypothetical protein